MPIDATTAWNVIGVRRGGAPWTRLTAFLNAINAADGLMPAISHGLRIIKARYHSRHVIGCNSDG
jgi:hypothetical protein